MNKEIVWIIALPADTDSCAGATTIKREGRYPIEVEAIMLACDFRSPEEFLDELELHEAPAQEKGSKIERLENHIIALEQDAKLPEDEYSYRVGFDEGFTMAHELAGCGHARANWKDPNYGTAEYEGEERCEFCEALK